MNKILIVKDGEYNLFDPIQELAILNLFGKFGVKKFLSIDYEADRIFPHHKILVVKRVAINIDNPDVLKKTCDILDWLQIGYEVS